MKSKYPRLAQSPQRTTTKPQSRHLKGMVSSIYSNRMQNVGDEPPEFRLLHTKSFRTRSRHPRATRRWSNGQMSPTHAHGERRRLTGACLQWCIWPQSIGDEARTTSIYLRRRWGSALLHFDAQVRLSKMLGWGVPCSEANYNKPPKKKVLLIFSSVAASKRNASSLVL